MNSSISYVLEADRNCGVLNVHHLTKCSGKNDENAFCFQGVACIGLPSLQSGILDNISGVIQRFSDVLISVKFE